MRRGINQSFKTVVLLVAVVRICFTQSSSVSPVVQGMINAVSSDSLSSYIRSLTFAGGRYTRVAYSAGYDTAVQYVARTFRSMNVQSVEIDTIFVSSAVAPFNRMPLYNISATLRGKSNPSSMVVVGGHLDTYAGKMSSWPQDWQTIAAPGADDNASGVAGVLELARILSDSSMGFSPDATIIFVAFGAEEASLVHNSWMPGSTSFARKIRSAQFQVRGMLNLDMIGYGTDRHAEIVSDSQSQWMGDKCLELNVSYSLGFTTNQPPYVNATYSDHSSFWYEGIPAILLIERAPPVNPYYHTSWDTLGTLNPQLMKGITQLALAAVATWSSNAVSTAVENVRSRVPISYSFLNNYPNPFNPSTTIEFKVGEQGKAALKVFNVLGQEVAFLFEADASPLNVYRREFLPNGQLPSGVYLARLEFGGKLLTRKLLYLK